MLGPGRLIFAFCATCSLAAVTACDDGSCPGGRCHDAAAPAARRDAGVRLARPDAACALQTERGKPTPTRKVDVIFVIDNSSSMDDEIAAVRANINQNFAAIISASAVDFRVVMLSLYGTAETSICVEPPLSGASCAEGLDLSTTEHFFHYNQEIDSVNALCQILDTFDRADKENRAPDGWQGFLRPEAEKDFVVISDDSAGCLYQRGKTMVSLGTDKASPYDQALHFHEALLAKSAEQFGTKDAPRYRFFSIVGLKPHAVPSEPYFPYEDLQPEACDTAPSPGLSYQALSVVTDALRYPVCEGRSFDAVFRALARSVLAASEADCVFELPKPPPRQSIDLASVNIDLTPGDGSPKRHIGQISAQDACKDDHSFYIRDAIELCPETCAALKRDTEAQIDIAYACTVIPE